MHSALERAAALLDQRSAYGGALRRFADPAPGCWSGLSVRSVGRLHRVAPRDVRWMESAGNYVSLHLAQRTLLHRCTPGELECHLDPADILRIHRRTLVRRSQMLAMRRTLEGSYFLQLRCGEELAVSERHAAAVKEALCGDAGRPNARQPP